MQHSADTNSPKCESLSSDIKEIQSIVTNEDPVSNEPAVLGDSAMETAVDDPKSLASLDFPEPSADALPVSADMPLLSPYNLEDPISPMAVAPSDFNEIEIIGSEQKPKYDLEPELCANPITETPYDMGMFTSEWGINVVNDVGSTVDNVQNVDSLGGEPACLDGFSHEKQDEIHETEMVKKKVETNDSKNDEKDDKASKTKINIGGCIYSDVDFTDDSDSEESSSAGHTSESNDESHSSDSNSGVANKVDLVAELVSMETTGETQSLHHSVPQILLNILSP